MGIQHLNSTSDMHLRIVSLAFTLYDNNISPADPLRKATIVHIVRDP